MTNTKRIVVDIYIFRTPVIIGYKIDQFLKRRLILWGGKLMKKARIIYNPTAGRENFKSELAMVLDQLEMAGYETSAHATKGEGDAVQAALYAADRNFDLVVAVGGDGTINEVINGLATQPKRPMIGIIPAGTTNDFA